MSLGERLPAVVVGAGPAGLAVARELVRQGVVPLVLERTAEVGAVWAGHYDRLRLNTPASTSFLPGRRFPRAAGTHPSRDAVVEYLRAYARDLVPPVRTGTEVTGISRAPSGRGWLVTGNGLALEADAVVLATGSCALPRVPDWPGRDSFAGRLVHSSRYRNAQALVDRTVLVAGGGNSAFDVALDAVEAGATKVYLSVRSPAHLLPATLAGIPIHRLIIATHRWAPVADGLLALARWVGGLTSPRLPFPQPRDPVSVHYRRTGIVPVANALASTLLGSERVEVVGPVAGFEGPTVVLDGGRRVVVDEVVAATGFVRTFDTLTGPGPRPPGIYALGFSDPLAGNLREIRREARVVARAVSRQLVTR